MMPLARARQLVGWYSYSMNEVALIEKGKFEVTYSTHSLLSYSE
jgi:hypothetical protein